jgi:hypothetical protein
MVLLFNLGTEDFSGKLPDLTLFDEAYGGSEQGRPYRPAGPGKDLPGRDRRD